MTRLGSPSAGYINTWLSASVPVPAGALPVQLIWEAWQDKREDHSSIALDDITIRNEACEAIGSCDFEKSTCGWQNVVDENVGSDKPSWVRGSGEGGNSDAPSVDHDGSVLGMFLYVGSTIFGTGLALLESQMLIPEQHNNLCFHFWWFLEGADSEDTIWIRLWKNDGDNSEIWRQKAGTSSGAWQEGQVHIKADGVFEPGAYQIRIGGMRATELSTIAIDDFYMTQFSGSCDTLPPDHVTPAPTDAPSLWECDFENGHLCSMYGMGEATWVVLTGENTDHDDGEKCISLLGSKGEEGRRRLPGLTPQDGPRCFTFWHFLSGAEDGELSIIVT
ncbi:apical endosomal glycoprotein-like [Penaeus vannamei]|uniref:apical endosomal glycoprotein-like n=1 Tax=Penaeus vannamei TaxID=6689 RepID=UPI00387F8765